jgi:hypothetical protein
MLTRLKILFCLSILLSLKSSLAQTLDLGLATSTDYIVRGYNLYDGASLQPSIATRMPLTEKIDFSTGVWSQIALEGDTETDKFIETDLYAIFGFDLPYVRQEIGAYWYKYPSGSDFFDTSSEFYSLTEFDIYANPSLSVFHDYLRYEATYFGLSVSPVIAENIFCQECSLVGSATTHFGTREYRLYETPGYAGYTMTLSLEIPLKGYTLLPLVGYNKGNDAWTDTEYWCSLGISYSFDL